MKIAFFNTYYKGKSPEQENMLRYEKVFKKLGHSLYFITSEGMEQPENTVHADNSNFDLNFVTDNAYPGMEVLPDNFSMFVNWCPSGYLTFEHACQYGKAFNAFDGIIVSCFNQEHTDLVEFFTDTKETAGDNYVVFPSVSSDNIIEPKTDNDYKIFYIGINKDKGKQKGRYYYLLKNLEKEGILRLYGPKDKKGISCWKDFSSYVDEIPFDGESVIKEINKSGICLALQSPIHNAAGNITNRIFEACAAGAIIITDDNVYTRKHFKDSVYYVDISKDEDEIFKDVMQIVNKIKANPEQARQKALQAQKIFLDKFTIEKSIENLLTYYNQRMAELTDRSLQKELIDIVAYVNSESDFAQIIEQINKQYYKNVHVIFTGDYDINISGLPFDCEIIKTNSRSRGEIFTKVKNKLKGQYFTFIVGNSEWHKNFLTKMIENLHCNKGNFAYCGTYNKIVDDNIVCSYETLNNNVIKSRELFYGSAALPEDSQGYFIKKFLEVENKLAISSMVFSTDIFEVYNDKEIAVFENSPHLYLIIASILKAKDYGNFCYSFSSGYRMPKKSNSSYGAQLGNTHFENFWRCQGLTLKHIFTVFHKFAEYYQEDYRIDILERQEKKKIDRKKKKAEKKILNKIKRLWNNWKGKK